MRQLINPEHEREEVAAAFDAEVAERRGVELCEKGEKERAVSPAKAPELRKMARLLALF